MAHLNSSIVVGGDEFEPTSTARESYQAYPYLQTETVTPTISKTTLLRSHVCLGRDPSPIKSTTAEHFQQPPKTRLERPTKDFQKSHLHLGDENHLPDLQSTSKSHFRYDSPVFEPPLDFSKMRESRVELGDPKSNDKEPLKSTTQDHFQHRPTQRVERSTMDLQRTHIFVGEERDLHTTQRDSYVKIQNTSQLQHSAALNTMHTQTHFQLGRSTESSFATTHSQSFSPPVVQSRQLSHTNLDIQKSHLELGSRSNEGDFTSTTHQSFAALPSETTVIREDTSKFLQSHFQFGKANDPSKWKSTTSESFVPHKTTRPERATGMDLMTSHILQQDNVIPPTFSSTTHSDYTKHKVINYNPSELTGIQGVEQTAKQEGSQWLRQTHFVLGRDSSDDAFTTTTTASYHTHGQIPVARNEVNRLHSNVTLGADNPEYDTTHKTTFIKHSKEVSASGSPNAKIWLSETHFKLGRDPQNLETSYNMNFNRSK